MALKRWRWVVVAVAVVLLGSLAASASAGQTKAPKPGKKSTKVRKITIGFPAELSGTYASYGQELLNVARLAVADINKTNHTVKVRLIPVDDQSTPAGSVAAAQTLVSQKPDAIIGYVTSADGLAAESILGASHIPTMFVQVSLNNNTPKNVFTIAPDPGAAAPLALSIGLKNRTPKPHTIAFIYQDQPTLNLDHAAMGEQAAKMGLQTVASQGGAVTQTDFSSQITAALAPNPDVIAVLAFAPQSGTIVTQLRQRGFQGPILAQQVVASPPFRAAAGDNAIGVIFGTSWDPSAANAASKQLIARYHAAYPSSPPIDVYGVQTWDALHIMVTSILSGKSYGATIKALHAMTFTKTALADKLNFATLVDGVGNNVQLNAIAVVITATGTKLLGRG